MKQPLIALLSALIFFCITSQANGDETIAAGRPALRRPSAVSTTGAPDRTARDSSWNWLAFDINQITVLQSGGNSLSAELAWRPTYHFNSQWAVRGDFGITYLKGTAKNFLATEYQILFAYSGFKPIELEFGGGAQSWFSGGATKPLASVIAAWKFEQKLFSALDRIFIGYSGFFVPSAMAHELKIGVGLTM